MTQDDLTRLISKIRGIQDTGTLWETALDFYHAHGIKRVSYHVYGEQPDNDGGRRVHTDGFPKDWVSDYISCDYAIVDPIPELARTRIAPFFWSEVENLYPVSDKAKRFLQTFRALELGDGLGMQVFGPNLRDAYVGLGFGSTAPDLSETDVALLQLASQAMHLRYCEITEPLQGKRADLSPRELEVLKWIARGKSNSVISELMGLSRHTVDTLVRRLFGKLNVTDRTTAAIKGIGAGFLHKGELPD